MPNSKKYKENHKDQIAEYRRRYRILHKEEIAEGKRRYIKNNREKARQTAHANYCAHREYRTEWQKQYIIRNKERWVRYHKQYRKDNKIKILYYQHLRNIKDRLKNKKRNKMYYLSHREYFRYQNKKRCALERIGGELTLQTIQQVYEDNIKKYGTLTCYLCELPIEFGRDHLEHRIPLSRGGTNLRNNLDISCSSCNLSKHDKTEEEYRQYVRGIKSQHLKGEVK